MSACYNPYWSSRETYGRAKEDQEYNKRNTIDRDHTCCTYAPQRAAHEVNDMYQNMKNIHGNSMEAYAHSSGTYASNLSNSIYGKTQISRKQMIQYVIAADYLSYKGKIRKLQNSGFYLSNNGEDAIIKRLMQQGISDLSVYNDEIKKELGDPHYFNI